MPTVTKADIDILYCGTRQRYRNVIPGEERGWWRAMARVDGLTTHLAYVKSERGAAEVVVRYLMERYGDRWKDVVKHTKARRSRVKRVLDYYVVDVFVAGDVVRVTNTDVVDGTGWVGTGWGTWAAANRAMREFKARVSVVDGMGRPNLSRV